MNENKDAEHLLPSNLLDEEEIEDDENLSDDTNKIFDEPSSNEEEMNFKEIERVNNKNIYNINT